MSQPATLTADDLLHLRLEGKRTELVRGRLRVSEPPGYTHGRVTVRLTKVIANYVDDHGLGIVLAAETGFKLASDPDTVLAADISFVRYERQPDPPPQAYAEMAPDLAVEVLSPGDRAGEILAKVADWLTAGTRLVWIIDPVRRQARVYRADGTESQVSEAGALDGEDVLPGFSCSLSAIL